MRIDNKNFIGYTVCDKKIAEVIFIRNMKKHFLVFAMFLMMICSVGTIQAAAKTVNAVTEAKTVTDGEWEASANGQKYRYADGSYAKSVWLNIEGNIYRIKKSGVCATGWFTVKGKNFYASETGEVYIKKWLKSGNARYYFQNSGVCAQKKWVKIEGIYYYFLKSGKMAKNRMIQTDGKYYYVNKSGERVKSMRVVKDGKYYYFNKNGVRVQSKWVKLGGKYYYFGSDGVMRVSQWIKDTYYVDKTGARVTDSYVDGYYLDENGKKVQYVFVGDSRMVGMKQSVTGTRVRYIAEVGEGYSWLQSTAGPQLKQYLRTHSNVTVVLALGVNDLSNSNKYISYYKTLINTFPKVKFYILQVNPIDEKVARAVGYTLKNSEIVAFNKKIRAAFPETMVIKSYKYLKNLDSFKTADGIHYTAATYQSLYDFIMKSILEA